MGLGALVAPFTVAIERRGVVFACAVGALSAATNFWMLVFHPYLKISTIHSPLNRLHRSSTNGCVADTASTCVYRWVVPTSAWPSKVAITRWPTPITA